MSPLPSILVATAFMTTIGSAAAQSISADTPESIVNALQDFGYRASLDTDGDGDPVIRTAASGINFAIYFYGCEENSNCKDLLFSAGFDKPDGHNLESMNDWNNRKLVGNAHLDDENDPYIDHAVISANKMSRDNFKETLEHWEVALGEFTQHIDW